MSMRQLTHLSNGSRIVTLIDQLDAALKEASLQTNSFGEKYSIYSFRHFYAVDALRNERCVQGGPEI